LGNNLKLLDRLKHGSVRGRNTIYRKVERFLSTRLLEEGKYRFYVELQCNCIYGGLKMVVKEMFSDSKNHKAVILNKGKIFEIHFMQLHLPKKN